MCDARRLGVCAVCCYCSTRQCTPRTFYFSPSHCHWYRCTPRCPTAGSSARQETSTDAAWNSRAAHLTSPCARSPTIGVFPLSPQARALMSPTGWETQFGGGRDVSQQDVCWFACMLRRGFRPLPGSELFARLRGGVARIHVLVLRMLAPVVRNGTDSRYIVCGPVAT